MSYKVTYVITPPKLCENVHMKCRLKLKLYTIKKYPPCEFKLSCNLTL